MKIVLSMILCAAVALPALTIVPEEIATMLVFPPYLHSYGIRKATQTKLKLLLGPLASFKDPQGLACVRLRGRDDPKTPNDDDEVTVYGVNSGRHQIIYNTSMYGITSFGKEGSGSGEFRFPKAVAADEDGNVYIADTGNDRIVHLVNSKTALQWQRAFGGKGTGLGRFNAPEGVALDSRGNLYIADTHNNRIQILDSLSRCARLNADLSGPTQLAVSDRTAGNFLHREDAIYVIDQDHRRIQKLGFDGKVLARVEDWPAPGVRYEYVGLDFYAQVYVTDQKSGRILKFDRNLIPLASFGRTGTGDREFVEPRGIAIWRRFGQVFVAEKDGAQYYWIGTDLRDVSLHKAPNGGMRLNLFAQEPSFVSIYGVEKTDTCFALRQRWIPAGPSKVQASACAGNKFVIQLEPTYSSYTYFAKGIKRNLQ